MPELLIKRTRFHVSAERLFAWHAEVEALERLTPPWEQSYVIRRTGTIRDIGSRIEIRVRVGPFWRTWISEHTAYEEGRMFRDSQIKGPFAVWRHTQFRARWPVRVLPGGSCGIRPAYGQARKHGCGWFRPPQT
jgi:ligand-binding SRPBCC domain-containing protein